MPKFSKKPSSNPENSQTLELKLSKIDILKNCVIDPIYFIKNFLYVQHPVKGRIPFKLYPFQEDVINDFINYQYNIIVKSRQLGLSTVTSAYCLWLALFHRDKWIMMMATKLEVSRGMIGKIRVMLKMLPEWMLKALDATELEADSVRKIELSNGSVIEAITTAPDSGRSKALSLLILDEAAHIEDLEELWLGIFPTLSEGGNAILFSSPNGKGFFYELYAGAETGQWEEEKSGLHSKTEGKNGFHAIKLPWTVHPDRDEAWYQKQTRSMSPRAIAQELDCQFEGSAKTFFQQHDIDWVKETSSPPLLYSGPNGFGSDFLIWKEPVPLNKYIICADVARGDAADNSAFHVINETTCEVVAEYTGKIPPDRFGEFLVEVGKKYNMALIIQEKNSFGLATGYKLRDLGYPNLYYDEGVKEKLLYMTPEEAKDIAPGFTTKQNNRDQLLAKLEETIRNRKIKLNSLRFAEQMETFIYSAGNRASAKKKKRDDLIMALAIGLFIFTPNISYANSMVTADDWNTAFLKSISRDNKKFYGGNNPQQQQTNINGKYQKQIFMGKELTPGVRKENVALDYMIRSEFDWVLK